MKQRESSRRHLEIGLLLSKITSAKSNYNFGDNSYFINFNYTDTLEKRFGVDEINDYHIHGEATDPEDIIFGHSSHPEMAFPELMEQKFITTLSGGKSKRLQGLYLIEAALYMKQISMFKIISMIFVRL